MHAPPRSAGAAAALLCTAVLVVPEAKPQATPLGGESVAVEAADDAVLQPAVQAFLNNLREGDHYTRQQGAAAAEVVRTMTTDPYTAVSAITEALREIYPGYGKALHAFATEDLERASATLPAFAASEDPFLAADSQFFLARLWMLEEHYEQALPVWEKLAEESARWTPYSGQALFYRGIAECGLLQREAAAATLEQFLDENPTAPERLRSSAVRQLDLLARIQDGSLADVQDQMEFSRRRLTLRDPGPKTQQTQTQIVEMLTRLIKEAEQSESQNNSQQCPDCQGKGCQKCQGAAGSQGSSPGSGADNRTPDGRPGSEPRQQAWDHLRDKQREAKAFAAIKAHFPQRYEELVKQYYETLQSDSSGDE